MKMLKIKRSDLRMISFRVDDETLVAIEELVAAVPGRGLVVGVTRRRSMAIRKALLEARDRLRQKTS